MHSVRISGRAVEAKREAFAWVKGGHPLTEGYSDFYACFASLLPLLSSCYWIVDGLAWRMVLDEDTEAEADRLQQRLEALRIDVDSDHTLYKPRFLPLVAPRLYDDHSLVYGCRRQPDLESLIPKLKRSTGQPFTDLPRDIDVVFYNWDGVEWQFFARESTLVEAIAAKWRAYGGEDVYRPSS